MESSTPYLLGAGMAVLLGLASEAEEPGLRVLAAKEGDVEDQ
jgi:hypothetical protein